jgi:hypothetical protein
MVVTMNKIRCVIMIRISDTIKTNLVHFLQNILWTIVLSLKSDGCSQEYVRIVLKLRPNL